MERYAGRRSPAPTAVSTCCTTIVSLLLLLDFNLCAQRLLPSCMPRDPS